MRNTRVLQVQVDGGGATYAAGGTARVLCSQLGGMSKPGLDGNHSFLGGFLVRASNTVLNSTGGAATFQANKAHDFIRRVYFGGGAWNYLNFPFYGGQMLRILRRLYGRNAEHRADDVAIANAGSATDRLRYVVPGFDPRARVPEDTIIPARSLKDTVLEMTFANGAAGNEWGANFSTSSGQIDEISALLIDKDHFRKEVKWAWIERTLQQLNDTTSLQAGHKYTDVLLCPRQSPAGGIANTYATVADLTKIEYVEDLELLVRNTSPNNLASIWNMEAALADEVELPRYELAVSNAAPPFGNEFIPVKTLSRARRQGFVAGDLTGTSPQFNLTGTMTPANWSILARYVDPTLEDDLVNAMVASGLRPSDAMLSQPGRFSKGKSDSKTTVRDDKEQFLARKLEPNGVR